MGRGIWQMGTCFWVCFFSCFISVNSKTERREPAVKGTVFVNGKAAIANTDEDFVCATLDWWPPEKCDYGTCSWDHASLLNLDPNNKILLNAIKAFSPLKIRLGGTLQDKVIYGTEDSHQCCIPFSANASELFGFSEGCLPLHRWDQLSGFFKTAGARVIFGLNALIGRTIQSDGTAVGAWNFTNAESLISYSFKQNYTILGWELGNELSGSGVGTRVSADQYASDVISLKNIVGRIYKEVEPKPLVIAPGGFFDKDWFKKFLRKANNSIDAVTHHIYNLGPGVDEHLIEKILDPSNLDGEAYTFSSLRDTLKSTASSASAWVGEAGGAYNSGRDHVTNAFVFSFWYLDQLGMASAYDTKTYCRQTLIGGNYGLLNTTTFAPNPDYYSALLWHRLMGRKVLSTQFNGTKKLRVYAHCAKKRKGVTVLLINLDNTTAIKAQILYNNTKTLHHGHSSHKPRISGRQTFREEYHLQAKDGNLLSQIVLLNGKILAVNSSGVIPNLEPVYLDSTKPISVAPFSIAFAYIPKIVHACRRGLVQCPGQSNLNMF